VLALAREQCLELARPIQTDQLQPARVGACHDVGARGVEGGVGEVPDLAERQCGLLEQLRGDFVRAVDVRDAVRNDVVRCLLGIPGRRHDQRPAGGDCRQGGAKAEHAAQGWCKQHGRLRVDAEAGCDITRMPDHSALIVQHKLRRLGGARGGEHGAAGCCRAAIIIERRAAGQRLIGKRALAEQRLRRRGVAFIVRNDALEPRKRGGIAAGEDAGEIYPFEFRPEHQHAAARALQDVRHLMRAEARVDRHRDGAKLGAAEEGGEPGGHVRQPQRDPIARQHAQRAQAARHAPALRRQLGKADRAAAIDQRRRVVACTRCKQLCECLGDHVR
jgi:hypothetical protein